VQRRRCRAYKLVLDVTEILPCGSIRPTVRLCFWNSGRFWSGSASNVYGSEIIWRKPNRVRFYS
jgi:hypothetical protein